jgi:hypothetical protein
VKTHSGTIALSLMSPHFQGQTHFQHMPPISTTSSLGRYKELFAIMQATKQWRTYLSGRKFTIYTDHMPLRYLHSKEHLPRRHADYLDWLSMFNFDVVYKPGKANRVADALSRRADLKELNAVLRIEADEEFVHQLVEGYTYDKFFDGVRRFLRGEEANIPNTRSKARQFRMDSRGIIYEMRSREPRICVPKGELRARILREFHDDPMSGHMGIERTLTRLQKEYWWPTMRRDVKNYVKSCEECQANKTPQQAQSGLLQPLPIPVGRWTDVSMDFIGPLPRTPRKHNAIIVFVDRFTKRAHFAATRTDASARETARLFFRNVVRLHGLPRNIVCDRDRRFTNLFWSELMRIMGTDLRLTTAYHPQSNGQVERTNRTLIQILRAYVSHNQDDWDEYLDAAEFAYNSSEQESTHLTPFYADLGWHPRTPSMLITQHDVREITNVEATAEFIERLQAITAEIKAALGSAQERQEQQANRKRRGVTFEVGERVFLSTEHARTDADRTRPSRKLAAKYSGPYKIVEKISDVTYRLDLPPTLRIHPVFHVSRLKRYHERSQDLRIPGQENETPPPPPVIIDGHEEWEVEDILAKRMFRGRYPQYLVKWKGYPVEASTWQSESDLENAAEIVREFEMRRQSSIEDDALPVGEQLSQALANAECQPNAIEHSETNMEVARQVGASRHPTETSRHQIKDESWNVIEPSLPIKEDPWKVIEPQLPNKEDSWNVMEIDGGLITKPDVIPDAWWRFLAWYASES